jgi:hypothetical protein
MFLGSRARPVRRPDNLTAVNRLSRQCGINISQPYRPPVPLTGIALLYFYFSATKLMAAVLWDGKVVLMVEFLQHVTTTTP